MHILHMVDVFIITPWLLVRFLSNHKRFALRSLLHVQTDFQIIPSNGFFLFSFIPGLDGLSLPTTPSAGCQVLDHWRVPTTEINQSRVPDSRRPSE